MESEQQMSQKPGPEHLAILKYIIAAGAKGATTDQITNHMGMARENVRGQLRQMQKYKKIKGMVPGASDQPWVALQHVDDYRRANGLPNLPPPSTTVMAVTKAQPRNSQLSPDRIALEQALLDAEAPMSPVELAKAAGLEPKRAGQLLQSLAHCSFASNVGTSKRPQWRASVYIQAAAKAASAKSATRVCNASMPTMRHGLCMAPARADALQHLEIMSRRGDQLVPAMPPMLIGSGIGGGMR
jgi:hypothetical protein